jgi:hypothetical protein
LESLKEHLENTGVDGREILKDKLGRDNAGSSTIGFLVSLRHKPVQPIPSIYLYQPTGRGLYVICNWGRLQNCEKTTIGMVMSVRLSVPMEQLGPHWMDFHEILYFSGFFFRKTVQKIKDSLKSDKNIGYFT